ncbi:hypothetical protein F511_12023 [Dorcoceras hygrometricum]|uniref:Uncharacterized protein n=1 Tax=Dorcoceras hygrometricum TaxID=472368 RepID=A0A2Z7CX59_9LAMI|nr:hypothetical protein F511_12023 [Dorcoceras hygrometricum]
MGRYLSADMVTSCFLLLCVGVAIADIRQSGPRLDPRFLRQTALEVLTRSARTDSPRKTRPEQIPAKLAAAAAHGGGGGGGEREGGRGG